jgi:phage portal protein BeeE
MISPRFADTFAPDLRYAAAPSSGTFDAKVGPIVADQSLKLGTAPIIRADEQLKAFTYWNYIAITRVADACAAVAPQFGTVKSGPADGERYRLDYAQRNHLVRNYGILQSTNMDVAPLPESHPIVVLFSSVNPEDTWPEFCVETIHMLRLTGKFYWWAIPNGLGLPCQLVVIPTHWVREHWGKTGVEFYRVVPDGDHSRKIDLPPNEVVKGKLKNPRSKVDGYSPIQAGSGWVDNVETIERARRAGFRNGINPDALITFEDKDKYADVTDDLLMRIKEKFIGRTNGVDRHGEPIIAPAGVKIEPWSRKNTEMGYGESADQSRDNNLALHGTPPVVAGISSDYTRATADAAAVVMCTYTLNPTLRLIAGVITEKVAPKFDARIRCWFPDCTPDNAEFRLQQENADSQYGALTPDERRIARGREPFKTPQAMSAYIPASMTPLDPELVPEPVDEPDEEADELDDVDDDEDDPADDDEADDE